MKDFYFSNEEDEKNFLKNQKWLIHTLIIEGVKKSFKEGLDEIVLFRIINPISNFIMISELKKEDWGSSLNKSLEYFESIEQKLVVIELLYQKTYLVVDLTHSLYRYEYKDQNYGILRKYKPNLNVK